MFLNAWTVLALVAPAVILIAAILASGRHFQGGFADRFRVMALQGELGAITLSDAQVNVQDDVDYAVIDQYRRASWLLDQLTFDDCVNPGTGGATLTYGYTRLVNARKGAFRAINAEYTPGKATRQRYTTDLKPLGDSFQVDRVIAHLGSATTNEVSFQMGQAIEGAANKFIDAVVNGDTAVDANGFDGLSKALTGSSTEMFPGGAAKWVDWTNATINTQDEAHGALDVLDEFLALVVGGADALIGNRKSITRVRSLARRAGYYTRDEDALGRMVERYGNTVLIDAGTTVANESATETDVVPIYTKDPDGAGSETSQTGLTDLYAVRFGLDAFHGVSTTGPLVQSWLPDFTTSGAVKTGEVEMGPLSTVLKKTTAAAVLRQVKVQ
jgi:hypothetical protein